MIAFTVGKTELKHCPFHEFTYKEKYCSEMFSYTA